MALACKAIPKDSYVSNLMLHPFQLNNNKSLIMNRITCVPFILQIIERRRMRGSSTLTRYGGHQ